MLNKNNYENIKIFMKILRINKTTTYSIYMVSMDYDASMQYHRIILLKFYSLFNEYIYVQ